MYIQFKKTQLSQLPENAILVTFREQCNVKLLYKCDVHSVCLVIFAFMSKEISELFDERFTF